MLEQILRSIKDYFIKEVWAGIFVISDGNLSGVDFLKTGQYFKICGSDLNDGVYMYPATGMKDETFKGEVWALSIPPDIVSLASEVSAWQTANADVIMSPFSSESFGGYSYSKATAKSGSEGSGSVTWETVFADRLNVWRKIRYETDIVRKEWG